MKTNKIKFLNCSFIFFVSVSTCLSLALNTTTSVNVGVLLDLDRWIGRMGLNSINMSLTEFYASHPFYRTRIFLHARNSNKGITGAALAGLDLVKNMKVQAIIGPTTSMQAYFVANLGDEAHVPVITFSATSPILSDDQNPYFFRVSHIDTAQVKAISAVVEAFGWKEVVPIFVDDQYGEGIVPSLTSALQKVHAQVPYLGVISSSPTDEQIAGELSQLMKLRTRVFVVHMSRDLGSRLFAIAEQKGMMAEGYVWIMTDGLANSLSLINSSVIDKMQGVVGVKAYVPQTMKLEDFAVRWRKQFQTADPLIIEDGLTIYGLWAYDAATALAIAIEKVGTEHWGFLEQTNTIENVSDIEFLGVTRNGEKLREALSRTRFGGVSGEFSLVNGKLQDTTFEIINVNGNGERRVGFWTAQSGLIRKLTQANSSTYSTSKSSLGPIIWPGETTSVPKGWEIPMLRIGVPLNVGFKEFVELIVDPNTNIRRFRGYCIDIFQTVAASLPYDLQYEFIPFAQPNGHPAGTYDELIDQVHNGQFDAVVGDITIGANRSLYVDFTLTFTENGAVFLVPTKDKNKSNTWIFLKPLTWELWLTTGCFFVYIGFVVWVLEHQINDDFRGPISNQVGTSFWFSFSTLVFAQREKVVSNMGKFVVIIWVFVVLILTQSYTASLTSFLTVQQLRPTFTDVNDLLKNGANVGYQSNSFVLGILKQLGFEDSQLKTYDSLEECDQLLTLGTKNGGIDAAFDEIPYIQLLQTRFCSKYTAIDPTFKTEGFGFAFRKYSPLVPDFSGAILNLTEVYPKKFEELQNRYFMNKTLCPPASTEDSFYRLTFESLWGLFLIAGVTSSLALITKISLFLFRHRQALLLQSRSKLVTAWRRVCVMFRMFNPKNVRLYASRNNNGEDQIPALSVMACAPADPDIGVNAALPSTSQQSRYWTSQNGLIRTLGSTDASANSTPKNNLGSIIWPGDTTSVPKGCEIPTNGKKLRIQVPVKTGYTEFVKVTYDPGPNRTEVTGFCIDVFKAVLQVLPYSLSYQFIPFETPDGESSGTYDELNFDAAVGDTTITANRSNYVDFTLPYTESRVTMVVPVIDKRKKNAWAFLKPLTWDLWVASACSFVFIGFVVWIVEHRINDNFRGPPSHQIGTSLWFSFSTMVFSHREKVVSNLGRFVVIIWVFVVLILVQSYAASLTSLLMVKQLRPTLTDVNQLIKNRLNVGYLNGSFVYSILKDMGFQNYQLKASYSTEHCNELFTKGSANGGIAAAFDEVPYLKLFLGTYCSEYAMVEPTFKTGGFGFVFPKGSPLVADISRAILNVTRRDKMTTMENALFRKSSCPDSDASVSSNSVGLESFWGLFLMAGAASMLALIISAITFLYQQKHIWLHNSPNTSIWSRIGILVRIFDEKDQSSHTFKKREMRDKSETSGTRGIGAAETSPSTHCPPSPSSQTESNFSFHGDQGMFSPDYGDANPYGNAPQDIEITIEGSIPSARIITPGESPANN